MHRNPNTERIKPPQYIQHLYFPATQTSITVSTRGNLDAKVIRPFGLPQCYLMVIFDIIARSEEKALNKSQN